MCSISSTASVVRGELFHFNQWGIRRRGGGNFNFEIIGLVFFVCVIVLGQIYWGLDG